MDPHYRSELVGREAWLMTVVVDVAGLALETRMMMDHQVDRSCIGTDDGSGVLLPVGQKDDADAMMG